MTNRSTFIPQYEDHVEEPSVFGGDKAVSWMGGAKKWAEELAERMLKDGRAHNTPQNIFKSTGLWKGPEGKWRFEIPDKGASLLEEPREGVYQTLGEVLDHPALYREYPNFRDTRVTTSDEPASDYAAHYASMRHNGRAGRSQEERLGNNPLLRHSGDTIHINKAHNPDERSTLSSILHEVQHGVQARNDFAYGSNKTDFKRWNEARPNLHRNELYSSLMDAYLTEEPTGNKIQDVLDWWAKDYNVRKGGHYGRLDNFSKYLHNSFAPGWDSGQFDRPTAGARNKEIGDSAREALDMLKMFDPQPLDTGRMYWNTAGEREARNVQNRYLHPDSYPPRNVPTDKEGSPHPGERPVFTRDGIWSGLGTAWDNILPIERYAPSIKYND